MASSGARVAFTPDGVRAGLRFATPIAMSVAVYGVVFGVLARQAGLSLAETTLMNVVVFAGAAQMAALDLWVYPLPIVAIVVTVLMVNMRLIMLSASMRPWMHPLPGRIVYPSLHSLNDESWAVMMQRYRLGDRDAGIVLGSNLAVFAALALSGAVGHTLGSRIGEPASLGLDFAFEAGLPGVVGLGAVAIAMWIRPGLLLALIAGIGTVWLMRQVV